MEYTILGNTRNTKNLEVAWVDTDDEFAYNDFCNETIWEIAEELFGQQKADDVVNDLACKDSFKEAFKLLKDWGFTIRFGINNTKFDW